MPDNVEGSVNLGIIVETGSADKALETTEKAAKETKEKIEALKVSEKDLTDNADKLLTKMADANQTLDVTKENSELADRVLGKVKEKSDKTSDSLKELGSGAEQTKEKIEELNEAGSVSEENNNRHIQTLAMMNDTVTYTIDNIGGIPPKSDEAGEALDRLNEKVDSVNIKHIKFMTNVQAFASGTNSLISGLQTFIPLSDDAKRSLQQFQSVIQITTGSIQILKSLSKVMKVLDVDMKKTAVSGVAASFATNPALGLAAAAGIGAAVGGTIAYFLTQNVTTNNIAASEGTFNTQAPSAVSEISTVVIR